MHVHDLIEPKNQPIRICNQFLTESRGLSLFRNLSIEGPDARRVKIRQRHSTGTITKVFNEAFNDRHRNLFQRAMFANSLIGEVTDNTEPFFVFPINGYKYLYCAEVQKTQLDFQHAIDILLEQFDDQEQAYEVLKDLLTFAYTDINLCEGIEKGAEIIIYNIPSFVAVRCSSVINYQYAIELLEQ